MGDEPLGKFDHRVAGGLGGALGLGLVETLVIGERVRIGPRAAGVHQNGRLLAAAVRDRLGHGGVGGEEVAAVAFEDLQVRESGNQPGDVAAGGLLFDGDRDGPAVVLDQIQDGKLLQAGDVERFPEFAFAGGSVAGGGDGDRVGAGFEAALGVGATDCRQKLRSGGGGRRDDVEARIAPMGRHLAAAGRGVGFGSHGLEQHVLGSHRRG